MRRCLHLQGLSPRSGLAQLLQGGGCAYRVRGLQLQGQSPWAAALSALGTWWQEPRHWLTWLSLPFVPPPESQRWGVALVWPLHPLCPPPPPDLRALYNAFQTLSISKRPVTAERRPSLLWAPSKEQQVHLCDHTGSLCGCLWAVLLHHWLRESNH